MTYSISFSYIVDSKDYQNGKTQCFLDSSNASDAFTNKDLARKKDRFLVLYSNENPKESIIRLDYPV